MKRLILTRLHPDELPFVSEDQWTDRSIGIMQVGARPINTIERAWVPVSDPLSFHRAWSTPFVSCVPPGEYDLVLRDSPSKGQRWHFVNHDLGIYLEKWEAEQSRFSLARWSCMFHPANYWYQIEGCAGPGVRVHDFGVDPDDLQPKGVGVASSRDATGLLENYLEGETLARLTIKVNE